jgi:hypothetical protein
MNTADYAKTIKQLRCENDRLRVLFESLVRDAYINGWNDEIVSYLMDPAKAFQNSWAKQTCEEILAETTTKAVKE